MQEGLPWQGGYNGKWQSRERKDIACFAGSILIWGKNIVLSNAGARGIGYAARRILRPPLLLRRHISTLLKGVCLTAGTLAI
ncbi:MAG: hypothetical protein HYV77_00325 [Candidatus Wildermuthbacteria bacterium]|nr:hypothetical protein [Candidatus Wildermuthbacteria bacterium]